MVMKSNNTQLEEAKQKLEDLRSQLPYYHGLVTDHQQREVELQRQFRAGTGSFSALTEAKTSTATARELLEQHQSDVQNAQAEVQRLEAEIEKAKNDREWTTVQQERQAIEREWNEQVTEFTRQYLENLKRLEPLVLRRQRYFERMQVAARAVGIDAINGNRFYFDLHLGALQELKEFQPTHLGGGNFQLSLGQRSFRVTVQHG